LGDGYTSPAIANEKIYITGLSDDNLILHVLDLNGKLLNKKDLGKDMDNEYPGTHSTVCVNDGKLYIYNCFGQLFCLDEATLNIVWQKDLLNDFDGRNLDKGVTESPLIVGDKIFMTPGGKEYNMVALNKKTGELIWSSPGYGTLSSYCSPLFIGDQSVPMVITSIFHRIVAWNADTGEILWSHPQASKRNIYANTPIYSNGMIFSTSGYTGGSIMLRLKDGGKAVEQVWKNNVDNLTGGAVKAGDYVYTSGHQSARGWFCIDWNTGAIINQIKDNSAIAIIYADGMLYCYSDKGDMALVNPDPERFGIVCKFPVTLGTGQHWAHPVIHRGVLYIRHGDALMAYRLK